MADEETQQDAAAEDTGYAKRIPSVPKPDKNKFDQKVADLQEEITRLQAKMETVQGRMNELKGKSGKASGPVGEAKAQMRVLRQKKDTVINARKSLFDKRDAIKAAMDAMKAQASSMKSGLKFNNVEDITKQLKILEHNHNTTSMTLTQEKEVIKEIETLKSMKSKLSGLTDTKSKMDGAGDQRKEIQALIAEENKKLSAIQEEVEEQKLKLDKLNEKAGDQKDIFPALIREKERLSKEVDVQYDVIRTMRLKWREDNNTWFEASKIARVERDKLYKEEQERRQKEWEAKQEELEAEEAKKEPYEEEKLLCVQLLAYLADLSGDAAPAAAAAAAKEVTHLDGFKPAGKKYDDEEEFWGAAASKKSGGGKKNKGASKKKLVHSADTINTFGIIGFLPPSTAGAVADSITAVEEKAEWYKTAPRPEKKKKAAKEDSDAPRPKKEKTNQKVPDLASASFPGLGGEPAAAPAAAAPAAAAPAAAAPAAAAPAVAAPEAPKELTGAQQMAAAAEKDIPAEKRTYGDHRGLNMAMPDISGLQPIQGELPIINGLGKPLAVLVMAKYAKGDFRTYCDFSALATKYGDTLDFLGLMCDPEKADSEALLGKEGKALAEQNIERFTVENLVLAWDEGKAVCKELLKIVTKSTVGPGDLFIFNPSGKTLWLENASGSWSIAQGQYADQIQRMQANATLLNNGPRPMLPGDEDIEEECDMGEGAGEYVDAFAEGGNGDY